MAIPVIEPYPMPAEHELPENIARWTIDPARAVLLVHDMQNFFLRPFQTGQAPMSDLVTHVRALRERFTALGAPVAYTAQPGGMTDGQRGLLKDFWGPGMTTDPEHKAILAGLEPGPDDIVLTKWRPSAFCRTDLLERMRAGGRDQLVICGVYAHVGILMTAHEGFSHDIQTFLVADAIADFSSEYHRMALDYAAARCSVAVSTRIALGMIGGDGR
ncbi:phenazine biosynthesis protein PhzD [Saccharothrix violaceirubra]|uniref:Bifunctional isochorismate lyase/aryl carrier protein n=1 Tax=Saccharothrix violaceirubra TaxID=413306 RepID=A0A7W7T698_9PSEU|nr:isochorismatase family protein [Saccharothrix violaceirubra]MBB4967358.1 bifunctional isochorismate lyase/aryl carrier protein [Saccharothrix violaceirubra]